MANIMDSLFGPTPYDVGQQRNQQDMSYAEKVARMGGFEQAKFGIGQGAAGLTRAGAGMMGMVDPLQQEAQMRESVMGMGGDLTTSVGLKAKAMQFAQAGDQRTAMKLAIAAKNMEADEAKIKLADQAEKRKEYAAKPDAEKYAMAMAKRSNLVEGTREFDDFVSEYMWDQKNKAEKKAKLSGYATQLIEEGIPEGSPEFMKRMAAFNAAEITSKTKPVGTSVTVSTGKGDSKYAEKRLSDAAEQLTALGKSAESAWKANQALDRFSKASGGGAQGGAQPIITATQNFLSSFGYTADTLKDTRQMEQAIGDILGNKMAELGARGLTDKDMEVLRQSLPRVDTDKASRDNVVEILKKANNNVVAEYENARLEEARVYPDLSKRIPDPAWYKAHKLKVPTNTSDIAAAAKAELERRGGKK